MHRFGRYALSERIAQGGMAEVWRGALIGPMGFTRPLAIKCIREESASDPEFVRMLVDEARIASTLNHPNIVQVTDLGEIDGLYFIAMEYVAGRHLGQVIAAALRAGQPIPRAFAMHVVREGLLGLHHAHARLDAKGRPLGIVHRDISPQNIMVGFDGSVRVADFGIAKAMGRATQTDAGVLKGKYAYMSPEQARGETVDARADLYAMGVVLFETLCGKRMHPASLDTLDLLKRVAANSRPRVRDFVPDIPEEIEAVVERGLALDPSARFPDGEQFATALAALLGRLAPGYGGQNVSAFMRSLFGAAVDEEQQKLSELGSLARSLSSVLVPATVVATPSPSPPAAPPPPLPPPAPAAAPVPGPPPRPPTVAARLYAWWPAIALAAGVTALAAVMLTARTASTPPASPVPAPIATPAAARAAPPPPKHAAPRRAAPAADRVRTPRAVRHSSEPAQEPPRAPPAPEPTPAPVRPPPVAEEPAQPAGPTTMVRVDTIPFGATVSINGQARGAAPLTVLLRQGQPVVVSAALQGRQRAERRVTPHGDDMVVMLELVE